MVQAISALIVTYNAERFIQSCLEAALAAGIDHIIVVDNASRDRTTAIVESFIKTGKVQLTISTENAGFARGVNLAASHAPHGNDLLLLNPDCHITSASCDALKAVLDDPEIGAVAPAMSLPDKTRGVPGGRFPTLVKEFVADTQVDRLFSPRTKRWIASALEKLHIGKSFTSHIRSTEISSLEQLDWVSGFCMLTRREAWEAAGGLDERFFLYFEDVAYCKVLSMHGYKSMVLGSVDAFHDESASAKSNSKNKHYRAARLKYFSAYGTPSQRRIARIFATNEKEK